MQVDNNIKSAAEAILNADALLITAGAGIGVDSGLPDFRGNEGFWKAYPPIAKLGKSFSEMANPEWFYKNPNLAWAFYGHRLNLYRKTRPHEGFKLLLEIGKNMPYGYFVFTSNVDGQFQKAGFDNEYIEECHGSIHHFQCVEPCSSDIWDASGEEVVVDEEIFEALGDLPTCPSCGGLARPNILMFGDWNWNQDRSAEQGARLLQWQNQVLRAGKKMVVIESGAGEMVATVRYQSERAAQNQGVTLIRINPRDYHVPHNHISIPLGALEGVRRISKFVEQ